MTVDISPETVASLWDSYIETARSSGETENAAIDLYDIDAINDAAGDIFDCATALSAALTAMTKERDEWKSLAEAAIRDDAAKNIHYAELQHRFNMAMAALRSLVNHDAFDPMYMSADLRAKLDVARAALTAKEAGNE
jgi:adenosine deaminase